MSLITQINFVKHVLSYATNTSFLCTMGKLTEKSKNFEKKYQFIDEIFYPLFKYSFFTLHICNI